MWKNWICVVFFLQTALGSVSDRASVLWLAPCCKPMEKALFDIVFLPSCWTLSSLQNEQPLHNNILVVEKVECAGWHSWIYNSVLTADVSDVLGACPQSEESNSLSSVKRQACVNAYPLRISIRDALQCLVVWQSGHCIGCDLCQARASSIVI